MTNEICSHFKEKNGCQQIASKKACSQVEVKRLWSGNGDCVPVACRCGLTGKELVIGENIQRDHIPAPKREYEVEKSHLERIIEKVLSFPWY
jgi:hypothetical protein